MEIIVPKFRFVLTAFDDAKPEAPKISRSRYENWTAHHQCQEQPKSRRVQCCIIGSHCFEKLELK